MAVLDDRSRRNQHHVRDRDDRGDRCIRDKHRAGKRDVAKCVVSVPHGGRICDRGPPAPVRNQLPAARSDLLPGGALDVRVINHIFTLQSQQHLMGHAGNCNEEEQRGN